MASPRPAALLLLMLTAPAAAQPVPDRLACEAAIAAQEPGSGLPPGLLGAIAEVEAGRWDPGAGRPIPWPWAIHAEGAGHMAPTREAAVARVRALLARGVRSVDVGCMQVNLRHHPDAFASLEEAFDPARNLAYAIRFLHALHRQHGSWPAAVARYHSGTLERGEAYARRVERAWAGGPRAPARPDPLPGAVRDRVAVMLSPQAQAVQVIRPSQRPTTQRPVAIAIPPAR